MNRSIIIRVAVSVVILVFVVGTWLQDGQFHLNWLKFFSVAVFLATLILWLWDIWLWRLPWIQLIPGVPRSVRGTWKGTLTSLWIDPSGQTPPPKTAYLIVRQTATLVSTRLLTNESRSSSTLADVRDIEGAGTLTYTYINSPGISVEHRSRMHHGSAVIDCTGNPVRRLRGRYWTDRDSKGELNFTVRNSRLAGDFDEAASLFGS